MREIKFRVWTEVGNEVLGMRYFDLSDTSERNNTIMQYTGLKDKNDKEIYEGDIIKFTEIDEDSAFGREETHIVEVKWIEDIAQWRCEYKSGQRRELHLITDFEPVYDYKVIGNIYDNQELIK